jgi:DNA repair photolyase
VLRRLPVQNPASRFERASRSYDEEFVPEQGLERFEDQSRSILSENKSPDLGFRFSLNAYRGCAHGCSYCYARPSHEYLGFGSGTDFERKLLFKPRAAELLRARFEKESWKGELIVVSGNTDAYQPLEAELKLTRKCLEVCVEFRNPVHIITKAALVERDLDLLQELDARASVSVSVSVTSLDETVSRSLEPYAPPPRRRLETIRRLAAQGIRVRVHVAPWIPGLTDHDLVPILEAAREAGASSAMAQPVRLPGPVAQVFEERLRRDFPQQAEKVLGRILDIRAGRLNDPRFGSRMRGTGAYAQTVRATFEATCRRLGYLALPEPKEGTFQRPAGHRAKKETPQLSLFPER